MTLETPAFSDKSGAAKSVASRVGQRLLTLHDGMLQGFGALSALGLLAVPVLVSLDVIARHAGGRSIIWVADACEYILYVVTMLSAPWLLRLGRHVRVDILQTLLPPPTSRLLEQAINVLMLAVCLLIVAHAFSALGDTLKYGTMIYKALPMPVWPFIAIFIASFSAISLELVVRIGTGRSGSEGPQSL